MKFQLVLQWPTSSLEDFDAVVELEDLLIEKLDKQDAVDGHDFGSGETNIFILTEEPHRTFSDIRAILAGHRLWKTASAAYRKTDGDEYCVLWPERATRFIVR